MKNNNGVNGSNGVKEKIKSKLALFYSKTKKNRSGCIEWTGRKNKDGYGLFDLFGTQWRAHRFSFFVENSMSPLDDSFVIAHQCGNRSCVNADHLEEITQGENARRALMKTHCKRGHELSGKNEYKTMTGRVCRLCKNASNRKWKQKIRSEFDVRVFKKVTGISVKRKDGVRV